MSQPKMSELMRAAARGCMVKYDIPARDYLDAGNGVSVCVYPISYRIQDYEQDKTMQNMFYALAEVYEAHEKQGEI